MFLILLFWKFEKSKSILRIPCSIIWFNKSNVVKALAFHYIVRHTEFSPKRSSEPFQSSKDYKLFQSILKYLVLL